MERLVDNEWMQHIPDCIIPVKADQYKYSISNENEIGFHSNPVGVKLGYGLHSPDKDTDEWKLLVRKNINEHAFKTDEEAFQFQYNVQDYLYKSYQFCYEDEDLLDKYAEMKGTLSEEQLEQFHLELIQNPLLTQGDVRDYYLDTRGIWYIRNDVLYYMDAGAKLNIKICEVKNALMMMPVSELQGMVITMQVTTIQDVRQTVQNRGYPGGKLVHKFFTKGIYEGYDDEYIISVRYEEINVASIVAERMKQLSDILQQEGVPPKQSASEQQTKGGMSQNDSYEKNRGESADMGEIEKWTSKMKPQGTERYFRIDRYCDAKSYVGMRDQHWQRIKGGEEPWGVSFMRGDEPVLMPRDTRWDSVQIDVAVYDDKMYTISYDDSDGYLCMSAIGETQNKGRVLAKAKISVDKLTPLVANDQGIFVVDAGSTNSDNSVARILWFDHEGSLIKNIMISGDVQETYICGKLLFYLKADNDDLKWCNGCSAYWMDMETEEEHCIFHARYEKQPTENITRCVYVKHIFGNERGAVMLVRFGYEHDVEDGCILNQCGWCYYDFKKIGCLSNSKNGPQHIYNKPEDYERWIEECLDKYGHDPYYINIMAFDMEKNLMWVSKKQNGNGPWEPMNITLDLQKRKRPDLSDWNLSERIEELKESDKIYFDGKRCYTYLHIDGHRDSFCSIDAQGRIERWPVESERDFRVLGDYVRIIGKLENSDVRYSTQSTPFHYFPTSHEFRKLLCVDENEYPYCVYDMRWMIEEYKEKQLAADEERENQNDWRDMSGSDDEDDWRNMTELDDDSWVKIPAEPENQADWDYIPEESYDQDDWGKVLENIEWDISDSGTEDGEKDEGSDNLVGWGKVLEERDAEETEWDWELEEPDENTTVSGHTDPVPADSAAQLEYWEGFSSYADSFGLNPAMTLAKLGSRTWQALRLKPSYIRIECSFSARKNSLRTAFIVEGHPEVFAQAERICGEIDSELQGYDITWDGESNAANISLTTSIDGMSRTEQYNWFCRAAEALYDAVRTRLDV